MKTGPIFKISSLNLSWLVGQKLAYEAIPMEASTGVPISILSVFVVCRSHSLRLGMSGWSSLALGVGNQSNGWWWMTEVSGLSLDFLLTVSTLFLDCLWTVSGMSLDCLWLSLDCVWSVSGLSLDCRWIDWLTGPLDLSLIWLDLS